MDPNIDYHREEVDFWANRVSPKEIAQFTLEHRVEVLLQADMQYHCYIDYKEGNGSNAIGLTFLGALCQGIHEYKLAKLNKQ